MDGDWEAIVTPTEKRRAVLVLSVGERPWFNTLEPSIRAYSDRVRATLRIERRQSLNDEDRRRLGFLGAIDLRSACNFLKILLLRDALATHSQALLLDDSCFVTPSCPDLFDAYPEAGLAAAPDGGEQGRRALPGSVYNCGVLVASSALLPFLDGFESEYARQGRPGNEMSLLNRAIGEDRARCMPLDPRFNWVGSQITEQCLEQGDAWIYHLTSYLHDVQRVEYAARLAQRFSNERAAAAEPASDAVAASPRWVAPRVSKAARSGRRSRP